jgi:transketolase
LGVHPEVFTPGIEASTGSLGHGLAIAAGMAIANKKNNVFVVLSDGELMEGSVWETVLIISSLNLNNIIVVIDNNDLQSATRATNTHPTLYPIKEKFKKFGWDSESCNGHNSKEIYKKIKNRKKSKPFVLISKSVKGYPISFMKNVPMWHYRSPNEEEYKRCIIELNKYEK